MESFTSSIIFSIIGVVLAPIAGLLTFWAKMAKYQQKVDDLRNDMGKSMNKIDSLRTDVDTLKEFKVNTQKFIDKTLYQSSSPLSLTEFGVALVRQSGIEEIFSHEKDNLVRLLEVKGPKTKYDVQEMARELMDSLTEYPAFLPIKSYAYNSGKDLGQILRASAIILRDYYLRVHPEIKD